MLLPATTITLALLHTERCSLVLFRLLRLRISIAPYRRLWHSCLCRLASGLELVSSTTDHFLALPVQHGHCLFTRRVDPVRDITNSGSTFLRLSMDTLGHLEQYSKYCFRHLPIVYQYFVLHVSQFIVNYSYKVISITENLGRVYQVITLIPFNPSH